MDKDSDEEITFVLEEDETRQPITDIQNTEETLEFEYEEQEELPTTSAYNINRTSIDNKQKMPNSSNSHNNKRSHGILDNEYNNPRTKIRKVQNLHCRLSLIILTKRKL